MKRKKEIAGGFEKNVPSIATADAGLSFEQRKQELASTFASNRDDNTWTQVSPQDPVKTEQAATTPERVASFAQNRDSALSREQKRQAILAEMKAQIERSKENGRDKGRSM